jgi:predicted PurR-regulated permease PerM
MASSNPSPFAAPTWLRNLGFASWLLVGFVLIIVGSTWLASQTSTIVMPVITAAVIGAVAGPIVGRLEARRLPRAAGAALVLLGFVVIGVGIFVLVVAGITSQSSEISAHATDGLDKLDDWVNSLGADQTAAAKQSLQNAMPEIRKTLVSGVAHGIEGLTSLAFFLSFAALATFFVLKDAPVMASFVNRHLGLPVATAEVVTGRIADSFRHYFGGLTIIAVFNGAVVGLGAWILGVPLPGTIAVVTFVTAYVPIIGAWVAGIFAFLLALGSQGATDAVILAFIILLANGALQNILQPFVFGAALKLNPLAVLVVTIGAGCLFGLVGLTLAAPLTSAAVHISEELRARDAEAETAPAPVEPEPQPSPG